MTEAHPIHQKALDGTLTGADLCERVPDWAAHAIAEAMDEEHFGYPCYELTVNGEIVGYMWDDGDGWDWAEGNEHSQPDPAL